MRGSCGIALNTPPVGVFDVGTTGICVAKAAGVFVSLI
jgi:hypothetical protein